MWNEAHATGADHELSSLDEQMARIVAEAEAAAATVRSNLEDASRSRAEMLQATQSECAELRTQAEAYAAETRDEAERGRIKTEAVAQDMLTRAAREADEIRSKASTDAAATKDRADAIQALLAERLPTLNQLHADLEPLVADRIPPEAAPPWATLAEPPPVTPSPRDMESRLHPSSDLPSGETTVAMFAAFESDEPIAPAPALHIVEPVPHATEDRATDGDVAFDADLG